MTKSLYKTQDELLAAVFAEMARVAPDVAIILGGGTALARCYLHHRLSYDLDFFIDGKFDPTFVERLLATAGFPLRVTASERGSMFAAQLHGVVTPPRGGEEIKVSFVEDVFAGMFKSTIVAGIKTEIIDGLYHRKLRTISGTGQALSSAGQVLGVGARQTARDLFDLYCLDTTIEPIDQFIARINKDGANFPKDLFLQNLAAVPWLELLDECALLEVITPIPKPSVSELKKHFDPMLKRLMRWV